MADDQTTLSEMKTLMADFVAERNWEQFHDAKNLSACIAIEAAELMEHFQWTHSDALVKVQDDAKTMGEITEEVADVFAYLLSFATTMKIDLSDALRDKMVKNAKKYPADQYYGKFRL
ncbi:MAG: NTP pyrophosphohydrolase [Phycisphaerae bacterium]|nr:MAG: NTP pyrophosphohydrolase [Phycisphaerae bacterium]